MKKRKVNSYELAILKVYKYKGVDIVIREMGGHLFEYLFSFKNKLYGNHFVVSDLEKKKLSKKYMGGIVFRVALTAEEHIKRLRRDKILWVRLWYNVSKRFFDIKKVDNNQQQDNE